VVTEEGADGTRTLDGRVAVLTGAGGGLGSEIAREMARHGVDVVLADLDTGSYEKLEKDIEAIGRRAIVAKSDVSSPSEVDDVVALAVDRLGRIYIMVNNAGIEIVKPLLDTTEEEWDRVFSVNVKGVLCGIQAAARAMIRAGLGG